MSARKKIGNRPMTPKPPAADNGRPGTALYSRGGHFAEPSENVKDLSEASNKRQDDLREANDKLTSSKLQCLDEIVKLHVQHMKELNGAESRRVNEQLSLRADYAERLSVAEAKRIDAIRVVDVNAVSVASQRASDQATVLATQVSQTAEALRTLVASTANTIAVAQQQANTTISARITTLEQAQYEGKGKQSFQDPAIVQVLEEVKGLREGSAGGTGRSQGVSMIGGVVAVVVTLILSATGIFVTLNRAPTLVPQTVYAPPTPQPPPPSAVR